MGERCGLCCQIPSVLILRHTAFAKAKQLTFENKQIYDQLEMGKVEARWMTTTDEIAGMVSVKDIILMIGSEQEFNLREIARPALFIPESLYAKKVLELFKKNKNKFGVVVNEYGSTEGIITLHDLTESIFGDILEEDDTEEEEIVRRQDGSLLVEASMNIGDFMEEMGILSYDDIESEDFTTLGGLAMFLIGRIPKAGDIFTYKNLQFEVVDMDRGRVDKLLVIKREEEE